MLTVIGLQINEKGYYNLNYNRTLFSHWIYGLYNNNDINEKISLLDYQQELMYKKSYCIKCYYNKYSAKLYSIKENGFKYPTIE